MQEYINMNHPDPKKHQYVSFFKSGLRIVGCIAALHVAFHIVHVAAIIPLAVAFLVAEIVGIYEELV
jgi:F0F1-type ATP synthase assembly protein I